MGIIQDKEEFDNFRNKLNILTYFDYSSGLTAWQAACEYKQKEIDGRIDERNYLYDKIQKLEAENSKMKKLIRDLANNGMDLEIASRILELEGI